MTNFPTSLDSFSTKVDGVTTITASHINNMQDAILALENKIGLTNSVIPTSLDYRIRNEIVSTGTAHTITAVQGFNPSSPSPPFILGTNARNVTVTGLKAENSEKIQGVTPRAAFLSILDDSSAANTRATLDAAPTQGDATVAYRTAAGTTGNQVLNYGQVTDSVHNYIVLHPIQGLFIYAFDVTINANTYADVSHSLTTLSFYAASWKEATTNDRYAPKITTDETGVGVIRIRNTNSASLVCSVMLIGVKS